MARAKFTLDDAALQLVQLELQDTASARRLRDRVRRLAKSAPVVAPARAHVQAAASALGVIARGEANAHEALLEAGRRLEQAMRVVEDHEDACASAAAGATARTVSAADARANALAAPAGAETASARSQTAPAVEGAYGGMDPLMIAALAAFELEEEPTAAASKTSAAVPAANPSGSAASAAVRAANPSGSAASAAVRAANPSGSAASAAVGAANPSGSAASAAAAADPMAAPAQVAWAPDADVELLEGFVAESAEYLQSAESALLELEADPTSSEAVNTVFRCFHTIKGTAAFLGLERVSELAHRAESLMSRVRDRDIVLEGGYAELALRSVDVLGELVRAVGAGLAGRPATEPAGYAPLFAALGDPEAALVRMALAPAAAAVASVPAGGAASAAGADVVETWLRVRTDRLDRLVDTIGELVIAHSMIAQDETIALAGTETLSRKVVHASKIVRELQDLSIAMRMVPLKGVIQKLARVVRDAATKSGKQVELAVEGEDTEVDRNMVDVIADPLVHMIRNAVDHGIEMPAERAAAGKRACATIRLTACHAGGSVLLTLSDDGRGLNRARILEKAVARGLVDGDRSLSDRDIDGLIFAPGFSTAETVTDLSGRGVGLDVVRRSVEQLRGRIDIASEPGQGSSFAIRLPLTLAITDGMLVRVGGERYILPTVNIEMSFRPDAEALSTVAGRAEIVLQRGAVLPVLRLHRLLGVDDAETDPTRGLLVVVGSGERRCALLVDELLGQQQFVAKSLGGGLGRVPGISGGAILGDGRVGLILDVTEILALARRAQPDARAA
jgi:two-component system, chemotaxis family, sensor kinase CheA